jgi:hypothetical protein
MLGAASKTFFHGFGEPLAARQERFKAIYSTAKKLGPRRNQIAHGVVDVCMSGPTALRPAPGTAKTYAMYPEPANFQHQTVDGYPDYSYTSIESTTTHRSSLSFVIRLSNWQLTFTCWFRSSSDC